MKLDRWVKITEPLINTVYVGAGWIDDGRSITFTGIRQPNNDPNNEREALMSTREKLVELIRSYGYDFMTSCELADDCLKSGLPGEYSLKTASGWVTITLVGKK